MGLELATYGVTVEPRKSLFRSKGDGISSCTTRWMQIQQSQEGIIDVTDQGESNFVGPDTQEWPIPVTLVGETGEETVDATEDTAQAGQTEASKAQAKVAKAEAKAQAKADKAAAKQTAREAKASANDQVKAAKAEQKAKAKADKVEAKTKEPKVVKEKTGNPRTKLTGDMVVHTLSAENPKRANTASYAYWDKCYAGAPTVDEVIARCESGNFGKISARVALAWDIKHGLIQVY
jgi:colicin import membrane protein